ncbi:MAG: adenosylhomocysteinase [Clostridiales Family XIII bacterium]|jgi:adenosylhomocysteinase|nr:adenosylhomocysteinase [Clostridiales Family XIII bacterium]
MKYDIRDIKLAAEGRRKIDWVAKNMPLLNSLKRDYEKKKPFKGIKISLSIHLEAKTAYLCEVLKACGAIMSVTGSNTLSTKDDIAAALVKAGISTFAYHGATDREYNKHIINCLEQKPDIIIDDGADLTATLHKKRKNLAINVIGGCEETTTGIIRLKAMEKAGVLNFPMANVNDAKCKHLFDNRYGTGQSTMDAIMHNTNLIIASKTVVVVGYGWCGKGIAMRASAMGARVIVCEIDPVKALEAKMDGYEPMKMIDAAREGDIFISATVCNKTITTEHAKYMKDGAILTNAGHFDVEVDMADFKKKAKKIFEARENIKSYILKNGKIINIIANGKLVNIAASFGHPAEIMDMSFAVQFLAAKYILDNKEKLENKVIDVSEKIDDLISRRRLKLFKAGLDKLTAKQKEYLNSWG